MTWNTVLKYETKWFLFKHNRKIIECEIKMTARILEKNKNQNTEKVKQET